MSDTTTPAPLSVPTPAYCGDVRLAVALGVVRSSPRRVQVPSPRQVRVAEESPLVAGGWAPLTAES